MRNFTEQERDEALLFFFRKKVILVHKVPSDKKAAKKKWPFAVDFPGHRSHCALLHSTRSERQGWEYIFSFFPSLRLRDVKPNRYSTQSGCNIRPPRPSLSRLSPSHSILSPRTPLFLFYTSTISDVQHSTINLLYTSLNHKFIQLQMLKERKR